MDADFQWDLNDDGLRKLLEKLGDRVDKRTPLQFLWNKRLTYSDLKDHHNRFVHGTIFFLVSHLNKNMISNMEGQFMLWVVIRTEGDGSCSLRRGRQESNNSTTYILQKQWTRMARENGWRKVKG